MLLINSGEGLQRFGETGFIVRTGSLVYIPRGPWHGLHNPDTKVDLVMVAVFSTTGMESYFRAIGRKPEEKYKPLTPEQEEKIERLYGIQYKPG